MSTSQRLTLIGLYNYDSTLFDNLSLPTGYDNDTFINSLLLEHGEKCVLYSNPAFFKSAIGLWSNKWNLELTRIYDSLTAEYNPIYNYDRYETYTDSINAETTNTTNGTDNTTTSNNSTNTNTSSATHSATDTPDYDETTSRTSDEEHEHLTSAYNSSSYEESSKDIISGGTVNINRAGTTQNLSESSTQTDNGTGTESGTSNTTTSENENGTEERTIEHDAHLYGNIGVTTSAQMVTEVVEQRMKYNLYEVATRLFANELLIGIY